MKFTSSLFLLLILFACNETTQNAESTSTQQVYPDDLHLIHDISAMTEDGHINAVIEIPAGTSEKWEVNKESGETELEIKDGKPRIVNYLGYPANYGMIPQTLLSKDKGGDGDPLDVIVIGDPEARGTVVQCKVIGILKLLDRGEQDDKLIAVSKNSQLYSINSIEELHQKHLGILNIIDIWFTNYKGPGKMESKGYEGRKQAAKVLANAILEYQEIHMPESGVILPE
jgi:inorganic pyrophosphatase